jgi:hypothetical protein
MLDVLPQTYQNYEKGRIPPSELLFKLVDRFKHDVDIGWLLTGQGTASGKCHDHEIPNATPTNRKAKLKTRYSNTIEIEHSNLIKQSRDKALAKDINEDLIHLESLDKEAFRAAGSYIKGLIQGLQLASGRMVRPDRRKQDRRQQSDDGKIPNGVDRRSGNDRRRTGT